MRFLVMSLLCLLASCSLLAEFDPNEQRPPTDGDGDGDGDGDTDIDGDGDVDGDGDGDGDTDVDADVDGDGDGDGDGDTDVDGDVDGDSDVDSDADGSCSDEPWFVAAGLDLNRSFCDIPEVHEASFSWVVNDPSATIDTSECVDEFSEDYRCLASIDGDVVCLVVVWSLEVTVGGRLVVFGANPLVVLARHTITINGDISSMGQPSVGGFGGMGYGSGGNGASVESIAESSATTGPGCSFGTNVGGDAVSERQGGGGGSGIGNGGTGGCPGAIGGRRADCRPDAPHLLGGAGGGHGAGYLAGGGGGGGGVLSFTANTSITVGATKTISVAGGLGGPNRIDEGLIEGAAGGGGGGGTIVLDAPTVTVFGFLDAKGGRGGAIHNGEDEPRQGPAGGTTDSWDGANGDCAYSSAGHGGGGGAGAIYFRSGSTGALVDSTKVTPYHIDWHFTDRCE